MKRQIIYVSLTVLLLVGCSMGCGKQDSIPVVKASGTVLYKGEPLDEAAIEFHPEEGQRPASAVTDSTGHFTVQTVAAKADGAMVGSFRVAIRKTVNKAPKVAATSNDGPPGSAKVPMPDLKSVIPQKWTSPDTSGLTATIEKGKENVFTFEIE